MRCRGVYRRGCKPAEGHPPYRKASAGAPGGFHPDHGCWPLCPLPRPPGGVGEFIGTIGLTVILALVSSLVLSLTVIVSLAGLLHRWQPFPIRRGWWQQGFSSASLASAYRWTLHSTFRRPWLGVGLALVLPVMGFAVFATPAPAVFSAHQPGPVSD